MAIQRSAAATVLAAFIVSCSVRNPSPTSTRVPVATPSATPVRTPFSDPFDAARSYETASLDELIEVLAGAERALQDTPGDTGPARLQQAAYRQLVRRPEWRQTVYDQLPPELLEQVRANVRAGAELRALTEPRDDLPPWRIVAPPSADKLLTAYRNAERSLGVGWEYLAAIHLVETRMGRIRGTSTAGAKGPMQFLPSTWEAYGEGDIDDPDDAIMAAARYLADHGAPQDMRRALFAYNHSDHYVEAVSIYAKQMRTDPERYRNYHAWQVYYRTTTRGEALLYEGWPDG
jgi:membrane-bound lytic murein transglycosylase B